VDAALIGNPGVQYARASDGAYLAYEVFGRGPVDLAWQFDFYGNIDVSHESEFESSWHEGLASFSRLILHDRRATGLSSRNVSIPNLETRAADLVAVLDAVGSTDAVLVGLHESVAPTAILAATLPERVRGLVWLEPRARPLRAPDYPWGLTPDGVRTESDALEHWGTLEYARIMALGLQGESAPPVPDEEIRYIAKSSRQTCTPDVARELTNVWYETDIRPVLPAIQVPTLIIVDEGDTNHKEEARYIASRIPNAELATVSSPDWAATPQELRPYLDEIRRFVGLEPPPAELDTVLSTVLFTDVVSSTEKQASVGDRRWRELVERHHALVRTALARWHGVENDTAGDGFYAMFDGPARAIRCAQDVVTHVRDLGIEVRAGIHTGECELIDGKVGGIAVTTGYRIAALAQGSEVLISQTVKDLVAGSGFAFKDAGEHELKGVPDRWRLYRVLD
jgi:class 3 adenylate cyclase/pimeloyl-ACP methyl ester carboxylesterase